jgi:Outer membrane cytochrome MtrC/MtrF-like, domains II/IV/Class III cytochrome C family
MAHNENPSEQLADVPPAAHRRRDRIARAQRWMPIVALSAAAVVWAGEWLWHRDARYSPGPLTFVHATWDDRCVACHVSAQPLNANNWTNSILNQSHVADAQCQNCHAGPRHHAIERAESMPGCTSCHREHQGRAADLKRVANGQCVNCHRDLTHNIQDGATTKIPNVTGFNDGSHPEFSYVGGDVKDPRRIAFNHKLHLAEGLRNMANTTVPFTLADIPKEARESYRKSDQSDKAPVKLECASCHRTDNEAAPLAGLPRNAVQPARAAGAYILPIVFEQHCQACHPLSFPSEPLAAPAKPGAESPAVRHRLQPEEMRGWLRGYFTKRLLKDQLSLLDLPARPLPGKNPQRDAAAQKLDKALGDNIAAAERILLGPGTCGKCHPGLRLELGAKQRVEPVNIPTIWFQHARFDHASHRAVSCQTCHTGVEGSEKLGRPRLPGIAICATCHAPAGRAADGPLGGARHDCVECHRYHDGDHPLHGRGASSRQPASDAKLSLQQFLSGAPQ